MDKSYFAGFFDADGTVTIEKYIYKRDYKRGPRAGSIRYVAKAQVGNVCPDVCLAMHKQYGGSLYRRLNKTPTHRPIYVWHISNKKCIAFLKDILPYLVVKKHQAELAIELDKNLRSNWRILQGKSANDAVLQAIYAEREALHIAITSAKWVDYPIVSSDAQAA